MGNGGFAHTGDMITLVFVIVLVCPLPGFSKNVIKADSSHSDLRIDPAPKFHSNDICGDPECNLVCSGNQECRPTGDQCVMPPCCVAWECVGNLPSSRMEDECPPEWPEMGGSCSPNGLSCEYGWEICCGERVPDLIFSCEEGRWLMIAVDSRCDIGLPCEDSTTGRALTRMINIFK